MHWRRPRDGYEMSKTQFLRLIPDRNPNPELDKLEQDILKTANGSHRSDGFRRQDDVAGCEDLRGEPPARVLFRQHQLHVLGVSASGRDAGCGGKDWEMAILSLSYEKIHYSVGDSEYRTSLVIQTSSLMLPANSISRLIGLKTYWRSVKTEIPKNSHRGVNRVGGSVGGFLCGVGQNERPIVMQPRFRGCGIFGFLLRIHFFSRVLSLTSS